MSLFKSTGSTIVIAILLLLHLGLLRSYVFFRDVPELRKLKSKLQHTEQ